MPVKGKYQVELWGSSGGRGSNSNILYGGYTKGVIELDAGDELYLYVGGAGGDGVGQIGGAGGYNGGASATNSAASGGNSIGGGGGATDVRIVHGATYDLVSLGSRIMVAGGGGGQGYGNVTARTGNGCGLTGESSTAANGSSGSAGIAIGANQTAGGGCEITSSVASGGKCTGIFGRAITTVPVAPYNLNPGGGGGGGGWYGGGSSPVGRSGWAGSAGGGGSSYISGHTGSVATVSATNQAPKDGCITGTTNNECSISYTGYRFTSTLMIDGAGFRWTYRKVALQQMPNPAGGYYTSGQGHTGNGTGIITYLGN